MNRKKTHIHTHTTQTVGEMKRSRVQHSYICNNHKKYLLLFSILALYDRAVHIHEYRYNSSSSDWPGNGWTVVPLVPSAEVVSSILVEAGLILIDSSVFFRSGKRKKATKTSIIINKIQPLVDEL